MKLAAPQLELLRFSACSFFQWVLSCTSRVRGNPSSSPWGGLPAYSWYRARPSPQLAMVPRRVAEQVVAERQRLLAVPWVTKSTVAEQRADADADDEMGGWEDEETTPQNPRWLSRRCLVACEGEHRRNPTTKSSNSFQSSWQINCSKTSSSGCVFHSVLARTSFALTRSWNRPHPRQHERL